MDGIIFAKIYRTQDSLMKSLVIQNKKLENRLKRKRTQ